jgi:hypothetical protein
MAYSREAARAEAEAKRRVLIKQWDEEARARGTASPAPGDTYGIEAQARREWEADPELRSEFRGCYESWVAYARARGAGKVRIISRPT